MPAHPCRTACYAAILGILAGAAAAWADQTFYVAPDGNDHWSGTLAAPNSARSDGPFATLTRARDAVRQWKTAPAHVPGAIHVQLRGGTYRLTEPLALTAADPGTPQAPVCYEAFPGEQPILSGAQPLTGWQPHAGKIVCVQLPDVQAGKWHFRSLFAAGHRQIRARTPNVDPADPYRKNFFHVAANTPQSATQFLFNPGELQPAWAQTPDVEVHIFQTEQCRAFKEIVALTGVDDKTNTATVSGPECIAKLGPGDRYFVENLLAALDSPGEWYLDRPTGKLYFWPPQEITPTTPVSAPRATRLITITGDAADKPAHDIHLVGLHFQDTDYTPDDGCAGYAMGNDGVVALRHAQACRVARCQFAHIGKYAVAVTGGGANDIVQNEVQQGAEGGVLLLQSGGNTVADNHLHHLGLVYKHIGGVVLQGEKASDNVIAHNAIHDTSRYGISLKVAGSRNRIEYNRVANVSLETFDSGGIEVTQHDRNFRSGSVIDHNVVSDVVGYSANGPNALFLSWAIYLDSFAGGYTVTNNVCYRNSHGGIMFQGGKDNRVENNVFADSASYHVFITNFQSNGSGLSLLRNIIYRPQPKPHLAYIGTLTPAVLQSDNNVWFPANGRDMYTGGSATLAQWQQRGFDAHSLAVDPLFVDAAHDNYAVRPASPALRLGFQPIDISTVGPRDKSCRCELRPASYELGLLPTPGK